jgi:hypothetical protein
MNRRNRTRKLARRLDIIEARQRILVLCEGKRTEPEYIKGFKAWCRNPLVEVAISGAEGVPLTLVVSARDRRWEAAEAAKLEKDENLCYDQVWCVFDRDDHPRFNEAIKMAQDNGLELAISNPSFELWLLLHFRDNPGAQHRDGLRRMLMKHIPKYDKTVDFDDYVESYRVAHRRAADLDHLCAKDGEPFRNPSTGVYLLTAQIGRYSWLEAPSDELDSTTSHTPTNTDTTQKGRRSREPQQ